MTGLHQFLRAASFMAIAFQAFFDESISEGDEFVLGGHVASPEAWSQFSVEWEELLPWGTLAQDNQYHFKMSEMAQNKERMERVPAFYRIIERHVLVSLSLRINLAEFERAYQRAVTFLHQSTTTIVDFKDLTNPYYFAVRHLVDNFYRDQNKFQVFAPYDRKVDFIFDERSDKDPILRGWNDVLSNADDELRQMYGATPRFESDKKFLPLQAADLWAWWVREWYEYENSEAPEAMRNYDFGTWKGKNRAGIAYSMNEEQLLNSFLSAGFEAMAEMGDDIFRQDL